jgi:hypothetical protein
MRFAMADEKPTTMSVRAAALAVGAVRYFSGRPCVRGHLADRYTKTGSCVVCKDAGRAEFERADPERTKARRAASRERHKDSISARSRVARATPESRAKQRAWAEKNRAKRQTQARERYKEKPELREKTKLWREANPERAKAIRKASYEKRMRRPDVKVTVAVANGVRRFLKSDGKRGRRTFDCLPYTPEQLVLHLERRFAPGMSWDNYGQWHIDHVVPISAFNFETVEHVDFQRAWALSNLQPLWAAENQSKRARLDVPFQPSLAL